MFPYQGSTCPTGSRARACNLALHSPTADEDPDVRISERMRDRMVTKDGEFYEDDRDNAGE